MNTQTLAEHLEAASDFLKQGKPELALVHLLDVYEAGVFVRELGAVLRRIEDDLSRVPPELERVVDELLTTTRASLEPAPDDDFDDFGGAFDDLGDMLDEALDFDQVDLSEPMFEDEMSVESGSVLDSFAGSSGDEDVLDFDFDDPIAAEPELDDLGDFFAETPKADDNPPWFARQNHSSGSGISGSSVTHDPVVEEFSLDPGPSHVEVEPDIPRQVIKGGAISGVSRTQDEDTSMSALLDDDVQPEPELEEAPLELDFDLDEPIYDMPDDEVDLSEQGSSLSLELDFDDDPVLDVDLGGDEDLSLEFAEDELSFDEQFDEQFSFDDEPLETLSSPEGDEPLDLDLELDLDLNLSFDSEPEAEPNDALLPDDELIPEVAEEHDVLPELSFDDAVDVNVDVDTSAGTSEVADPFDDGPRLSLFSDDELAELEAPTHRTEEKVEEVEAPPRAVDAQSDDFLLGDELDDLDDLLNVEDAEPAMSAVAEPTAQPAPTHVVEAPSLDFGDWDLEEPEPTPASSAPTPLPEPAIEPEKPARKLSLNLGKSSSGGLGLGGRKDEAAPVLAPPPNPFQAEGTLSKLKPLGRGPIDPPQLEDPKQSEPEPDPLEPVLDIDEGTVEHDFEIDLNFSDDELFGAMGDEPQDNMAGAALSFTFDDDAVDDVEEGDFKIELSSFDEPEPVAAPVPEIAPEPAPAFDFERELALALEEEEAPEPVVSSASPREVPVEPPPEPEPTPMIASMPSLDFGDWDLDDEPAQAAPPSPPAKPSPGNQTSGGFATSRNEEPTLQMQAGPEGLDLFKSLLEASDPERVAAQALQEPEPVEAPINDRETRANPALTPDMVSRDSDFLSFDNDDWSVQPEASAMPGFDDDWFEPGDNEPPPMSDRDVHNDATAIPGLTASNSQHPFNPYAAGRPKSSGRSGAESLRQTHEREPLAGLAGSGLSGSKSIRSTRPNVAVSEPFTKKVEEEDDFDFDLGLGAPSIEPAGPRVPTAPPALDDEFDFDLGLSSPKVEQPPRPQFGREATPPRGPLADLLDEPQPQGVSGTMFGMPLDVEQVEQVGGTNSEALPEDEFFALADSLAAEQSSARKYRGEPIVRQGSGGSSGFGAAQPREVTPPRRANPFAHEAPTGVRKALLENSASFVLEEVEDAPASSPMDEARDELRAGNYAAARALLQELIKGGAGGEATELLGQVNRALEQANLSRLGSLESTPVANFAPSDLAKLNLDHRSGFLLSQIDGMMTFEDILDLSAMSRLETLEVLVDLYEREIIVTV